MKIFRIEDIPGHVKPIIEEEMSVPSAIAIQNMQANIKVKEVELARLTNRIQELKKGKANWQMNRESDAKDAELLGSITAQANFLNIEILDESGQLIALQNSIFSGNSRKTLPS